MRPWFAGGVCVCVCVVGIGHPASAQRGPLQDPVVREGVTEQISDHIYVIPDGGVPLVPNITIIVGSRGVFVVDTGIGARNGEAVLREVARIGSRPELYLATTHVHPEHDLGAHAFPATTQMIRSRDQVTEIAESGLQTAARFAGFSPVVGEWLRGVEFRTADVVFDREYEVDLGGVRVRVMAMGGNHTVGDTAFFVEPDRVLVSGDVVMSALPGFGSPSSRLSTWLGSLDRFESLAPVRIVPSHGPMGDATMIAGYRTFLTTVQARTVALKREGKTLGETVAVVQDELQRTYDRNRMAGAIRAAFNEAP